MATKKNKINDNSKKTKKSTKKSSKSKAAGKKSKNSESPDDVGIVIIDEDIKVDKDAELEARRLYLEEARSQETSD